MARAPRPPAGRPDRRAAERAPTAPTRRAEPPARPAAPEPAWSPPPPAAPGFRATTPVGLETDGWADFELLDMGGGRKLERYGAVVVDRPEPQALGSRRLPPARWAAADAVFTGDVDEEGAGRWRFARPSGETWPLSVDGVDVLGRFTAFRHVGLFPEQISHWRFAAERLGAVGGRPRVLNLFAYTGLASLLAARAGAEVTHVDASRKAIGWARENQLVAGMEAAPIRWICEDAATFVEREVRRAKRYEGVFVDPPTYGRGPSGEVWDLFRDLPKMLAGVRDLLSEKPAFLILTVYAMRASHLAFHELAAEILGPLGGRLVSGELVLRERPLDGRAGRGLSTSLYVRWVPEETP